MYLFLLGRGNRGQLLKVGSLFQPIEFRDQTQVIGLVWQVPLHARPDHQSVFKLFLDKTGERKKP